MNMKCQHAGCCAVPDYNNPNDPEEMAFNLGSENLMKGKIDHSKRAIIHEGMEEMADYCTSHVYDAKTPEDALLVCTMKDDEEYTAMVQFKWGYSVSDAGDKVTREDLKKINWPNNLDTVVDYENGVGMPPMYPFAIADVVRKHYGHDGLYIEEEGEKPDTVLKFFVDK